LAILEEVAQAVESGEEEDVKKKVQEALDEGGTALDIIDNGLMKGMETVGNKFADGEMFIPEVMIAAQALQVGIDIVKPHLLEGQRSFTGKVILGTVAGDIHDLGKNLVKMMLTANGFEVIDLGVDVPVNKFVDSVKENQPDILGMSALLTTTMPEMGRVVEALKENGLRDNVRVIVGGAPVNEEYAEKAGADLYAENALEAVDLLKNK